MINKCNLNINFVARLQLHHSNINKSEYIEYCLLINFYPKIGIVILLLIILS